jgi:hypothetical protein
VNEQQSSLAASGPPLDQVAQKTELECQKLALDIKTQRRNLSAFGTTLEVLRSAVVPATILGALITLLVGWQQIAQTKVGRMTERFERILVRLGSDNPRVRLFGVSSVQDFFWSELDEFNTSARVHLIDSLAIEDNPVVQIAILDAFRSLISQRPSQLSLNKLLTLTIRYNRSLFVDARKTWRERAVALTSPAASAASAITAPTPTEDIIKFGSLMGVAASANPLFTDSTAREKLLRMEGLAKLISMLVQAGAIADDFSDTYCPGCDFSNVRFNVASRFDRSVFAEADFTKSELIKTSFFDADLSGANFYRSNLSGANLSKSTKLEFTSSRALTAPFPLLACADLRGTHLEYRHLGMARDETSFIDGKPSNSIFNYEVIMTSLQGIKVDEKTVFDPEYLVAQSELSVQDVMRYGGFGVNKTMPEKLRSFANEAEKYLPSASLPGRGSGIFRSEIESNSVYVLRPSGFPDKFVQQGVRIEIALSPLANTKAGRDERKSLQDMGVAIKRDQDNVHGNSGVCDMSSRPAFEDLIIRIGSPIGF